MSDTSIWWEATDQETNDLIKTLGGKATVEAAAAAVLPGRRVKLRTLTPGLSGAVVFLASPQRTNNGRRTSEVDGVLKIGKAELLADEVARYDKWVSHVLAHASHFAPLDAPHDLTTIAQSDPGKIQALHYRHVGHKTLGERVRELVDANNVPAACRLIDSLLTILRPWQEMVEPVGSDSLTADGVYSFGSDPFDEFEATCARLNQTVPDGSAVINLALYTGIRQLWSRNALESERQLKSIVHGDLHIDNVLVGRDDTLTLIDFGATGEGHFLRDLTTLEAHLVLRGMSPAGNVIGAAHHKYIRELAAIYSPTAFCQTHLEGHVSSLQTLVLRLRRYAFYCLMHCQGDYMPQYALGVLRHAVRICTRPDDGFTDPQRWIAAQVSTMLADTLTVERRRLTILGPPSQAGPFSVLDDPAHQLVDATELTVPTTERCTVETWRALAEKLRAARGIDVVGIAPVQLISTLVERWSQSALDDVPRPRVQYLTVPRKIGSGASPIWKEALTGMRNVAKSVSCAEVPIDGFARASDRVTANCLIRYTGRNDHTVIYLATLVKATSAREHEYVLTEVADAGRHISDWVTATFATAEPIIIREVECHPYEDPPNAALSTFCAPTVRRLSPYGETAQLSPCLRPVALTILRARGHAGKMVVLKMRSPLVDNDDFGKLSFLSSRILPEDVAGANGESPMSADNALDAEYALDRLWRRIGAPTPFILQEEVFVHAAMRDLYGTTLLKLPAARFRYRGMHVITRGVSRIQLGFAVLTVDLDGHEVDEARHAGSVMFGVSDLLHVIPVSDLFKGKLPLNGFMCTRKEWLLENCLGRLGPQDDWPV